MKALRLVGMSLVVVAWISAPAAADSRCAALHDAVWKDDDHSVGALLRQGFDVNCRDRNRFTALIKAAGMGHSAVVRVLLRNGADGNARDTRGATAFKHAEESFLLSHLAGPPPAEKEQDFNEVIRLLRQAGGVR